MSPIIELLRRIKPRPGMYVTNGDLSRLAYYLRGYHQALAENNVPGDHSVLPGFRDFVAHHYSVTLSQSWENIIIFHAAHNGEALAIFWDLLGEYLAEQGISLDDPNPDEPRRREPAVAGTLEGPDSAAMTEAHWLACTDPKAMLEAVQGNGTGRKLQLFACACCRRVLHLMTDQRRQNAVEMVERYVDGLVGVGEMHDAFPTPMEARAAARRSYRQASDLAHSAVWLALTADRPGSTAAAMRYAAMAVETNAECRGADPATAMASEQKQQTVLLRDIFGPLPFHPVVIDSARLEWNGETVRTIARHIYDGRTFHDLPLLGEALEDAGCTNDEVITHCSSAGPHVRGCWVVDLVLGLH